MILVAALLFHFGACASRFGLETGQTQSLLDLIGTLSNRHHDTAVSLYLNFTGRGSSDFAHFLEDRRGVLAETDAGLTSAKHDLLSAYHSELDRVLFRTEPKDAKHLLATLSASARSLLQAARAEREKGYRVDMVKIGSIPDESDYNAIFQKGSLVDVWTELLTLVEQKKRSVHSEEGDSSLSLSSEARTPHRGAPRPVYVAPQEPSQGSYLSALFRALLQSGWSIAISLALLFSLVALVRRCRNPNDDQWTKFKRTAAKQALILPSHWRDETFVHHTD